jgi:uncharacterized damage-inducible protein DinB
MQKKNNTAKIGAGRRKTREDRFYRPGGGGRFGKPKHTILPVLLFCLFALTQLIAAQNKQDAAKPTQNNPLSTANKQFYEGMKAMLLLAAQKAPEEHYNFKPTDAVRSYAQIIGHLADSYYSNCALVLGEKRPALEIEKTKTSRAELITALKESFVYCDNAYNGMTDAAAVQTVKFMGADTTKLGVLTANLIHSGLHYGNLVTYMRMKNIVPPTTDPS